MKPILFNTEMVRAILEGRKTVTRRVVKFQKGKNPNWTGYIKDGLTLYNGTNEPCNIPTPYKVGDVLYVRETWGCYSDNWSDAAYFMYRADFPDGVTTYMHSDGVHKCDLPKWKPSIHMPKEVARIFLQVTDIRVERLQDITEEQAIKEGCQAGFYEYKGAVFGDEDTEEWTAIDEFTEIWNSTIKPDQLKYYGYEANPYVWVIEFEKITKEAADE